MSGPTFAPFPGFNPGDGAEPHVEIAPGNPCHAPQAGETPMQDTHVLSLALFKYGKHTGVVAGFAEILQLGDFHADAFDAVVGAGMKDVIARRVAQIEKHGFTAQHDMGHHPGTLAVAAASYLNTAIDQLHCIEYDPQQPDPSWPWEREAWRPGTARDNLVTALAIGLATLDRLDHGLREAEQAAPAKDVLAMSQAEAEARGLV